MTAFLIGLILLFITDALIFAAGFWLGRRVNK